LQQKYKILVSAYSCSPYHGSEPGIGWNFTKALSEFHELHVITKGNEFKSDLEKYLEEYPEYKKIKFHYIPMVQNKWLVIVWPPSYYWYYKSWQKKAFALAKKLDEIENFDIIHQLTQTGFREPGYLWKIKKPFVWGPIGGMEISPWRFLPTMGLYGFLFFLGRNLTNIFQLNFSYSLWKAANANPSHLIASTLDSKLLIKKYWHRESTIISEVGITNYMGKKKVTCRKKIEKLKIIWSGEHVPRKSLNLLLNSLALLKDIDFELHVLGNGPQNKKWKMLAKKLKLENQVKWHGWIKRDDSLKIMSSGHIFCHTSLRDDTATVTLEALSLGIPIICLDHCGFADVIDQSCGIKVPVVDPSQVITEIASSIQHLYYHEELRQRLAAGALIRAENFSWEGKMIQLNKIYNSLLDINCDQLPSDNTIYTSPFTRNK
jgi:glycosyltransferase involved in cell wall biosynthesis